jgi:hypothetical protein
MPADVVDLIMQDHREVERLFDELKENPEKRPNLLPVLTTLLTAHSRAEEAEVYPVAAAEAGEKEEVSHSQQEHIEADQLLAKLARTDPTSAAFDKALQNLIDAVSHHSRSRRPTPTSPARPACPRTSCSRRSSVRPTADPGPLSWRSQSFSSWCPAPANLAYAGQGCASRSSGASSW